MTLEEFIQRWKGAAYANSTIRSLMRKQSFRDDVKSCVLVALWKSWLVSDGKSDQEIALKVSMQAKSECIDWIRVSRIGTGNRPYGPNYKRRVSSHSNEELKLFLDEFNADPDCGVDSYISEADFQSIVKVTSECMGTEQQKKFWSAYWMCPEYETQSQAYMAVFQREKENSSAASSMFLRCCANVRRNYSIEELTGEESKEVA